MKKSKIETPQERDPSALHKTPKLHVRGVKSLSGNKFIEARRKKQVAFIPHEAFMPGGSLSSHLRDQGLILTGPHYRELQPKVDNVRSFAAAPLVEHPGWTGSYFSLPTGLVFSPKGRANGKAIFAITAEKCTQGGDGPGWRDEVAALVADQVLPAFLIMVAFAAPLLRLTDRTDNFGFEVVGTKGTGKTTILRLMSTVCGAAIDTGQGVYWQTLGSTIAGLETTMERHQDQPLALDEAGLFMPKENKSDRASSMVTLAFQLGSGHVKARWMQPQPTQYRFIWVISSNEPASQTMQGNNHDREAAALDRLITLPISDGGHGVFDSLPDQFRSGAAFAGALDAAMRKHFGRAFPRFMEFLVEERSQNEIRLRRKLKTSMSKFRREAGVNHNNGSAVRVCNAFGLVYAAGKLAKSYGILPASFRCRKIALEAYRRHLACRDERSPAARLLDLSRSDHVLRVPAGGLKKAPKRDIDKYDGMVFEGRKGPELLLTRHQLNRLFPFAPAVLNDSDVFWLLSRDSDHQTVKRTLVSGQKPERFYCFPLSGLSDDD